ncbi:T-complex protein 1 subunit beta [Pancytospora epiphaga]|nr:T-complex protein 1 subunit beta [Pancytospora epiphaga]
MELYSHKNAENTEERADDARRNIRAGFTLIGDILKSTLGPRGSLKVMQGKETAITNDGAFILKNLLIDSVSARIIASSSVSQDIEEGDGTTSIAVLTSLLLNEAYSSTVHPAKIIRGFSLAMSRSLEILNKRKFAPKPDDLKNLVKTTLNSKVLANCLDLFVNICIKAVEQAEDITLIEIVKLEGDLGESILVDGMVLNKDVSISLENPRILVANTSLDLDKVKIFSSKINVSSVKELEKIEQAEKDKMVEKIERITSVPLELFINRQIIYDYPMQLLKNKGIAVIEHADFAGVERLNKVLGGNLVSTFDALSSADLGSCGKASTITIKGHRMVVFEGIQKGASSIILFGSSKEMLDEAERSIHDALCVLKRIKERPFCVYGGGAIESSIAAELFKYALEIKTKESEGVECFARALQRIPSIIAENCGFDGDEIRTVLKNDHSYRRSTYGVNVDTGKSGCMKERGVIEGMEMKKRVIVAACETAQTILKCDGIVKCKPRERSHH